MSKSSSDHLFLYYRNTHATHNSKLFNIFVCLFVLVDALRPRSTAEVMSGRSVILSTLFLGKPPRGR